MIWQKREKEYRRQKINWIFSIATVPQPEKVINEPKSRNDAGQW